MRQAARTDQNQVEIVKALRQVGASVQSLAAVGKGCPDLLVSFRGRNHLIEVKDGSKPPSARRLTKDQKVWHKLWAAPVHVVTGIDEAIAAIK